jgi:hypothetical protein
MSVKASGVEPGQRTVVGESSVNTVYSASRLLLPILRGLVLGKSGWLPISRREIGN